GSTVGRAEVAHNTALAYRHLGQLERADDYERRAIEFAGEIGNARLIEMARVGRAEIALVQGDWVLAAAAAQRAARALHALGHVALEADAIRVGAIATLGGGDTEGAREPLDRAVALA